MWEQEVNPRICYVGFLLETFWVFFSCVSLSLSRGHLRINSYPYHFQVIMMHEPERWPAFPGSRKKEDSSPLSAGHSPPSVPLALAMGHSNWKDNRLPFLFTDIPHTPFKTRDGLTTCSWLNYILSVKADNAVFRANIYSVYLQRANPAYYTFQEPCSHQNKTLKHFRTFSISPRALAFDCILTVRNIWQIINKNLFHCLHTVYLAGKFWNLL